MTAVSAVNKPQLKVSVFSDYICPFCYVGSLRLLRLNEDYDLNINWCGVESHPQTPSEGMPIRALGYSPSRWRDMMVGLKIMTEEEGIDLSKHDFTTNSQKALLLAEAAKEAGHELFYRLHNALFQSFLITGRNIGDEKVLRDIANQVGVPGEIVSRAWSDPRYARRLAANQKAAQEMHLQGVPTYAVGSKILIGTVSMERLRAAAHTSVHGTRPYAQQNDPLPSATL